MTRRHPARSAAARQHTKTVIQRVNGRVPLHSASAKGREERSSSGGCLFIINAQATAKAASGRSKQDRRLKSDSLFWLKKIEYKFKKKKKEGGGGAIKRKTIKI